MPSAEYNHRIESEVVRRAVIGNRSVIGGDGSTVWSQRMAARIKQLGNYSTRNAGAGLTAIFDHAGGPTSLAISSQAEPNSRRTYPALRKYTMAHP